MKDYPHQLSVGLLKSIPRMDRETEDLYTIEGTVPPLNAMPKGCRFSNRCPECTELCKTREPPVLRIGSHEIACWKYEKKSIV